MSALLTQCPHCNTSFRVTEAQQQAAGGLVRCGSCLAVFSAIDNEIRIKPPVQERALDDIEEFFENLDRESLDNPALTAETATTGEEPSKDLPDTEIVFTMESGNAAQAEAAPSEAPDDLNDIFQVQVEPAEYLQPEESTAPSLAADTTEFPPERLDLAMTSDVGSEEMEPDETRADHIIEIETAADSAPAAQESTEEEQDAEQEAEQEEVFELSFVEPETVDAVFVELESAESRPVESEPVEPATFELESAEPESAESEPVQSESIELAFVATPQVEPPAPAREENDTGMISLGDMQIDEYDMDEELDDAGPQEGRREGPRGGQQEGQQKEDEVGTAQRTSAEDKVQVREYLSSLDDDETPQGRVDDAHLDELDEEPLTFIAPPRRSLAKGLLLFAANLMLLAVLGLQWLYWNRATLDEHPRFSFMAPYVCSVFPCPAPEPLPAVNALSSQQLLVRTHPRFPDALELSFIFNNDATTPQPFPNLELAFSDINNQLLANRLFTPPEYLPQELQQFDAMPPQTSVQVVIELVDPGEGAVNYNISFHDP